MAGSLPRAQCECEDALDGHPSDAVPNEDGTGIQGAPRCHNVERLKTLFRVDMNDLTGTRMCGHCMEDAFKSGLFDGHPPKVRR